MNANRGYVGWSKSVRAATAENEGKLPLSRAVKEVAARAGITQREARRVLIAQGPCEWHHTSKQFNRTDFYDCELAIERAANPVADLDDVYFADGEPCYRLFYCRRAIQEGRAADSLACAEELDFSRQVANYARHRAGLILLFSRAGK